MPAAIRIAMRVVRRSRPEKHSNYSLIRYRQAMRQEWTRSMKCVAASAESPNCCGETRDEKKRRKTVTILPDMRAAQADTADQAKRSEYHKDA